MGAGRGWIEVGKSDCEECKGTGVHYAYLSDIEWHGLSEARRRWPCRRCDATGQRSVGYMDLRDASGR